MKDKNKTKYIFVTGGVMSGVGKGITSASIGTILKSKGFIVNLIKADPYLNVDAGTMNPTEHGEVFVLDSGLECDQDMGNYERFLNINLPHENYMTNGMVLKYVIDKERSLGYRGKCVEAVFHVTEEILRRIKVSSIKTNADITIVEIGGTIGEYQNTIFIEAARLLKLKYPKEVVMVMVSYLPIPHTIGEMKTKPTQNAVRQLNSCGINPDIIIARSEVPLDKKRKEKIANSTGVFVDNVISAPDVKSIYDVPINFENDGLGNRILEHFGLTPKHKDLKEWRRMVKKMKESDKEVNIAIIGKYFSTGDFVLSDSYISVIEAIKFSSYAFGVKPKIHWLDSRKFENNKKNLEKLKKYDGVIVPGGFGESGIDGKLNVIEFVRKNRIPFFGLCYGMQLMVIEYARNVLKIENANTTEIDLNTENPVIDIMPDQKKKLERKDYGGSMRLGIYPAKLLQGSIARQAYRKTKINERHRHRFEVNPNFVDVLSSKSLRFSGVSPDGKLMEIAELPKTHHPFFLGVQFHPEFLARPLAPHPLFNAFIKSALNRARHKK